MGAIAFLVLFFLGVLLAFVGSIIGIVDAFKVSPVWGLLSILIIPLLVFWAKFRGRKWARNSLLIFLGGLLSMLASIPFLGSFLAQRAQQAGVPAEEGIPAEEVPVESIPVPEEQVATEEFAEPLVPIAPQFSPIARADLIQSTDPNERLQQINNSRTDPFAIVPIPPPPPRVIAPPPPPGGGTAPGTATAGTTAGGGGAGAGGGAAGSAVARAGGAAGAGGAGAARAGGTGTAGAAGRTSGGAGAAAGNAGAGRPTTPPPLAPLPQLPKPALAEAVLVTGVMTIGNENFAVVQTSAGSQYVKAGQRVSNGQVLVKRIDMRGSDPVVVLEENGIEVSRPVGAPSTAAEPAA
ncbi:MULTISPECIES: hypothetical protein [Cyanophyceae]|uniref:hypothetical protein n=1 Tax=Cyanophyceae TaxID=3028117 RepID=UPI001686B522|nr:MULTISPECIES: hypothetical protein [Cyanophyceae]MBD1917230.1 hypothetical protein [Phormidium sp. FACHB-77]MBD2030761.1 hypothetical protein [Phormidium sp. FACHB-322]MBD2050131.1 hypothetical protein [Leptolyngbya sp. FACHB-60]